MSHHGREYEDDRVEYVRDSPEESLERALSALGAGQINTSTKVHITCLVGSARVFAVGDTRPAALTELITNVAAMRKPVNR